MAFDDVRVPEANLVGERGRGYAQFLRILDEGRIAIAALGAGLAQGCVDESVTYACTREAFGRPIGANQGLAFLIADMEARAHTARVVVAGSGRSDAARRAVQASGGNRCWSPARPPWTTLGRQPRCSVVTVSPSSSRWAGSIGTPRFWRSAKGPLQVQQMLIARGLGFANVTGYAVRRGPVPSSGGLSAVTLSSPEGVEASFVPEAGMVGCSLTLDGVELLGMRGGMKNYLAAAKTFGIPLLAPWGTGWGPTSIGPPVWTPR